MKRMKFLCMLMIVAMLAFPAWADVSENFDAFTQTSYGTYDYNGFHMEVALVSAATSAAAGNTLPSNAVRLRDATGSLLEYQGIDGNGKDGGVGDISFYYRPWDGSPAAVYDVSVSINGGAYTIIGSQINTTDYTQYVQWSHTLNDASDNIKIRVSRVSGERLHIDDFSITDFGGGGGNETDAHVTAGGVGAQATISSLVDTYPEQQVVMTFDVQDDGSGPDGLNTIITDLLVSTGDANTVNWTLFIAGAELTDGTNFWTGTVSSGGILFSGAPLATLIDGAAAQTWSLSVYLLSTLPFYADNEILEFHVGPASFVTDASGAGFDLTDADVESGDLNNEIDIVATDIGITTQPPALVGVDVPFLVRAGFVDENNGIDEDWPTENMTLSVNTGIGNLSSVGGLTILSASGQSVFANLLYDALDTGVILQATSTSFPGPALADPFDTYLAPTIVIDAYPTCWDGNNTDQALPFVVHITIENWADAADQDAHLKVYEGGANPYHYTAIQGWTSSTSYGDYKPVIHIDANGYWAGWLPIKSNGLATFKPRARLVNNTSIQITGVNIVGNAMDLSSTGAIIQDSDGSTLAAPGNTILACDESNTIIGAYLAEDNGLPLDDDGGAIAPHGWRMAACATCDAEITFKSYGPDAWPGHGEPDLIDSDTQICAEQGETVEVDADVILPVALNAFTALARDASVLLNWSTASESDLRSFDVKRDGELVYSVNASNSPSGHEYTWTDENLTNGTTYGYDLYSIDVAGNAELLESVEATPSVNEAVVTEYALHQNFPNPFNPETSIAFDLVDAGFVSLKVYNLLGQEVASLVNGTMEAGRHLVTFQANDLPSGLYLYRIETEGFAAQKKMILMK